MPDAGRAPAARRPGPEPPRGEFLLEPPPDVPDPAPRGIGQYLIYLPMVGGAGAMVFMYAGPGASALAYAASAMYGLSSFGMVLGQFGRGTGDRTRKADGDRRDYLRYLAQARRRVRDAAARQRAAQLWNHPDPDGLWSFAMSGRRWERRPADPDFAQLRIAVGAQNAALRLIAPETKPIEDLEPLTAGALRAFVEAHRLVPDLPIAIALRNYSAVCLSGDDRSARRMVRAMLAQAATFHAPGDLRIAVCAAPGREAAWEWVKWLPHTLHPTLTDGVGPVRLVRPDLGELEDLLGPDLSDRPRFQPGRVSDGTAHLLVVLDGGRVPPGCQLAVGDALGVTVLDLQGALDPPADRHTLRLRVERDQVSTITRDPLGPATVTPVGRPDRLGVNQAEALAHQLMAHAAASSRGSAAKPAAAEHGLPALLGLGDPARLDPAVAWTRRAPRDRLRVPIGVTEIGAAVELDIKEAAAGGSGPHGLIIGATGSGKSELLRTLVAGLAATHSSQTLNFVLVDFKGGATFLGLESLPHVSAVITNLARELPLVDRMQDALRGELNRRQEVLRAAGNFSSVADYERARLRDGDLAPLPTLLVVVDEFSELLAGKPEFADLFVMIGRLGRSLAVHLLLASQRLEEGRLRGLETHLSYRICLRTFSANESRMVLGSPDAHSLPNEPGHAYLKVDVASMTRFRGAYVSGPYEQRARIEPQTAEGRRYLAPYTAAEVALPPAAPPNDPSEAPARGSAEADAPAASVLDVMVERLRGHGTPAHQVWLPPLQEPATLDALLPRIAVRVGRGLCADESACGLLQAPIGILDLPYEQRRDPLVADLSGAAGNVAVVGAPQSGKSSLIRTLICSLALTHTAREVQFYCLDFGGGALASAAALPHVGAVASRLEADAVRRTVAELTALLETRERTFARLGMDSMAAYRRARARGEVPEDPYGDVLLVVDGWAVLRAEFEALEPAITTLAARGLGYGIHVAITANRWTDLRPQLRDVLGTRFELRLGDPFESEVNRYIAANVPEGVPGRGIVRDNLHFLTALPRIDARAHADDAAEAARDLSEALRAAWQGPAAPAVRMLPSRVMYHEVAPAASPGSAAVPLGVSEDDLSTVLVDFAAEPHFLVYGETESGKTSLLRTLVRGITSALPPDRARVIIIDYRRTLLDFVGPEHLIGFAHSPTTAARTIRDVVEAMQQRLPSAELKPDELRNRSWWTGPDLYLVVDDYDLVVTPAGNPLLPLAEVLAHSRDIGLHVILARSTGGAGRAVFEPFLQRLRETGAPGVVLSGSPDEGPLLGDVAPRPLPPGRGVLHHRRYGNRRVQVAVADDE